MKKYELSQNCKVFSEINSKYFELTSFWFLKWESTFVELIILSKNDHAKFGASGHVQSKVGKMRFENKVYKRSGDSG